MATKQEEATEQAYFAERVKEQNQQEKTKMPVDIKPVEKTTDKPAPQTQAEVDPVHIEVTNCNNFRDSMILLLNGVAARITEAKDDPNAVSKVAAQLKERAGTWADACVANTTGAPAATVETEKGRQEREAKEKQAKPVEKK